MIHINYEGSKEDLTEEFYHTMSNDPLLDEVILEVAAMRTHYENKQTNKVAFEAIELMKGS